MVMGLIWTLLLLPDEYEVRVPLYLYYLMFLILGHFYAAHGHSIAGAKTGSASPLYLPRGTLRTLIFLGFVGVLGWRYYTHQDLENLLKLREPIMEQPLLPIVLLGAFFVGVLMARVVGRAVTGPPGTAAWIQDMQAWVALLAVLGLGVEVLVLLVINPSMDPEHRLHLPHWEMFLAGIVAFYFGARS
jgi:hypothetical protein